MKVDAENYDGYERAISWQLAVKLAEWQGMTAGIVDKDVAKTTFVICLPSGDVEIILPTQFVFGKWRIVDRTTLDNPARGWRKAVEDCLDGILIHRHTLVIPEKKETTE